MDILEVIAVVRHEPYLYTQIQQRTQMNPQQVSKYLVEMATKGLLTVEFIPHAKVAKKEFKITAKGRRILTKWLEFVQFWGEEMLEPKAVDKLRS